MAKGYRFYACYKKGNNCGVVCEPRTNIEQATKDLIELIKLHTQNDLIFIGVVKCNDNSPLDHIYSL